MLVVVGAARAVQRAGDAGRAADDRPGGPRGARSQPEPAGRAIQRRRRARRPSSPPASSPTRSLTANLMRPDQSLVDAGISPYEEVVRDRLRVRARRQARPAGRSGRRWPSRSPSCSWRTRRARSSSTSQNAFTDVQLAKLNLALARDNLKAFNDVVQVNTERVRTGDLSQVELSRSRLAALQFQNDVRQQETKLRVARNRLSTLARPRTERRRAGRHRRSAQGQRSPSTTTRSAAQALDARPDLRALRADQARSVADTAAAARQRHDRLHGQRRIPPSGRQRGPRQLVRRVLQRAAARSSTATRARSPARRPRSGSCARGSRRSSTTSRAKSTAPTPSIPPRATSSRRSKRRCSRQAQRCPDRRPSTPYRRGEASFVEFLDAVRAFNDTMQSYNEARADYARSLYTLDSIAGKVTP